MMNDDVLRGAKKGHVSPFLSFEFKVLRRDNETKTENKNTAAAHQPSIPVVYNLQRCGSVSVSSDDDLLLMDLLGRDRFISLFYSP